MSAQTPSWVVLGLGLWAGPFVFCMFLMTAGNFLVYWKNTLLVPLGFDLCDRFGMGG